MLSQTAAQAYLNTARAVAMSAWVPSLALYVGDPLAGGAEVVGGSYARQSVTFGAPVGYSMANTNLITFPAPSGTWGAPLTHMALVDASGVVHETYLLSGSDADRTVGVGTTPIVVGIGTLVYVMGALA